MTKLQNRIMSWVDGFFMRYTRYAFNTIIDIGASVCCEGWSWTELFPDKTIFLIEPKYQKPFSPDIRCLAAALGIRNVEEPLWCWRCLTTECRRPGRHGWRRVPMYTLDRAVQIVDVRGPYYIWMDVDGMELDILEGATETLKQTAYLHVEVLDGPKGEALVAWLKQHGWWLQYAHPRTGPTVPTVDHLYAHSIVKE